MSSVATSIPWREIDTVLLDMDGTLLDLAFDNYFWLQLVPEEYAMLHGLEYEQACTDLTSKYESVAGKLSWYCLDHWTDQLGLQIRDLKWRHRHLIEFLPGVIDVLQALRQQGKSLIIVTNAHRDTLAVKLHQTRLDRFVDGVVSSHDYLAAKEHQDFWRQLFDRHPIDREKAVLVEDSLPVLVAARTFGLQHTVAIRRPDSTQPARDIDGMISVEGICELIAVLR